MRIAILLAVLLMSSASVWADNLMAPKQLQIDPALPSTDHSAPKKPDRFYVPPDMAKERDGIKNDFNTWLKEDASVQSFCEAARKPVEHADCKRKQQISQQHIDAIHAHMATNQRTIDNWRREQRGLPPLPPVSPQPVSGQNNSNTAVVPAKPKLDPVLLPQNSGPLPAGTF